MHVIWVVAPANVRVRRSSQVSRPGPAGDLRSALTPAVVRRVDEAAGAGKMGNPVGVHGSGLVAGGHDASWSTR
jgi:hypothetical protein